MCWVSALLVAASDRNDEGAARIDEEKPLLDQVEGPPCRGKGPPPRFTPRDERVKPLSRMETISDERAASWNPRGGCTPSRRRTRSCSRSNHGLVEEERLLVAQKVRMLSLRRKMYFPARSDVNTIQENGSSTLRQELPGLKTESRAHDCFGRGAQKGE